MDYMAFKKYCDIFRLYRDIRYKPLYFKIFKALNTCRTGRQNQISQYVWPNRLYFYIDVATILLVITTYLPWCFWTCKMKNSQSAQDTFNIVLFFLFFYYNTDWWCCSICMSMSSLTVDADVLSAHCDFIVHVLFTYSFSKGITYSSMTGERTVNLVSSMRPSSPLANWNRHIRAKRGAICCSFDRHNWSEDKWYNTESLTRYKSSCCEKIMRI